MRDDVIKQVESSFPGAWQQSQNVDALLTHDTGHVYFNLWAAIKCALLDVGVTDDNVSSEAVCTSHNTDTFYSHRGEEGKCGLFGAVIGLRNG